MLAGAGYEVSGAGDGVEALELAQSRHFDLVVTDHNMPRMDGVTLVRALRPRTQYDPVALRVVSPQVDPAPRTQLPRGGRPRCGSGARAGGRAPSRAWHEKRAPAGVGPR